VPPQNGKRRHCELQPSYFFALAFEAAALTASSLLRI